MIIKETINKKFNDIEFKVDNILKMSENRILNAKWTERAINHFGTTSKPHEAAYLLYNGEMLDFSGGHKDTRQIDHSEIYQIYTDEELEEANKKYRYGGIIQLFQDNSNSLRISVDRYGGYIYLSMHDTQKITYSQIETLKYIEKYDTERHIMYDVYNKEGYSIKSGTVNSVSDLEKELSKYITKE